ncbi:MAG: hypothetical protein AABX01_02675 [Candidatus Micrarchaeota archaeon]
MVSLKLLMIAFFAFMIYPNFAAAADDYTNIITTSPGDQLFPAINGDDVAWSDFSSWKGALYYANLQLPGLEQVIISGENAHVNGIAGNWIAYANVYPGNTFDIWIYDLTIKNRTRITANPGNEYAPNIYGDAAVYQLENFTGYNGIYMANLTDGRTRTLQTYKNTQAYRPRIYGDIVVWHQLDGTQTDLMYFNLSTSWTAGKILVAKPYNQQDPDIYGSRVVWMDKRKGNWDIYMLDMASGVETPITDEPQDQMDPRIYGDLVVWADGRWNNFDIYMYNITSGIEQQLTWNETHQKTPKIQGKYVIWNDFRNGNADIYGRDLSVNITVPIHDSCFDTGSNPFVRGYIWGYLNGVFYNYSDYCSASSSLVACKWKVGRACNGNKPSAIITDCYNSCLDGACNPQQVIPWPTETGVCIRPSPSPTPTPSPRASPSPGASPGASINPSASVNPNSPTPTNPPGGTPPPRSSNPQFGSPTPTRRPFSSPSPSETPKEKFDRIIEDSELRIVELKNGGEADEETQRLLDNAKLLAAQGRADEALKLAEEAEKRLIERDNKNKAARMNFIWMIAGIILIALVGGGSYYYYNMKKKEEEIPVSEGGYESSIRSEGVSGIDNSVSGDGSKAMRLGSGKAQKPDDEVDIKSLMDEKPPLEEDSKEQPKPPSGGSIDRLKKLLGDK